MRSGFLFSLTLHAALALLLIAGVWLFPGRGARAPVVLAEVELVEQNTPAVGRAAGPAAATERPAAEPTAEPAQPSQTSPPPLHPALAAPLPLPPPAAPPAPPSRVAATHHAPVYSLPAEPLVRLGGSGSLGTGLVSGSEVIPAALDQAVRNVPPAYPPRAVRQGEQGSVILRVHIGADGSATKVDIFRTSGYGLLDRAAEGAVGHWHFVAAREKGLPIPSTMLFKIRFVLTNPEGGQ